MNKQNKKKIYMLRILSAIVVGMVIGYFIGKLDNNWYIISFLGIPAMLNLFVKYDEVDYNTRKYRGNKHE